MVYEHLCDYFMSEDLYSLRVWSSMRILIYIAKTLEINKILVIAKDIKRIPLIMILEIFLHCINYTLVFQLCLFIYEHYSPNQFGVMTFRVWISISLCIWVPLNLYFDWMALQENFKEFHKIGRALKSLIPYVHIFYNFSFILYYQRGSY